MRQECKGSGLINSTINALPLEIHLPGYRFCGPGTKLKARLSRGEEGINPLDEACKEHDIAYSKDKSLESRLRADRVLADKAWSRFKDKDVPFGEKLSAWVVTSAMNAKTKLGGSLTRRGKRGKGRRKKVAGSRPAGGGGGRRVGRRRKGGRLAGGSRRGRRRGGVTKRRMLGGGGRRITLGGIVTHARSAIRGAGLGGGKGRLASKRDLRLATLTALKAVRHRFKTDRNSRQGLKRFRLKERVLALPKSGGVLPLLPIFAGLSAIGSLAGGVAGVAKAISETRDARKRLAESQRHNETMEAIALRRGKGLYLKPYRKGLGLYMTPYAHQRGKGGAASGQQQTQQQQCSKN